MAQTATLAAGASPGTALCERDVRRSHGALRRFGSGAGACTKILAIFAAFDQGGSSFDPPVTVRGADRPFTVRQTGPDSTNSPPRFFASRHSRAVRKYHPQTSTQRPHKPSVPGVLLSDVERRVLALLPEAARSGQVPRSELDPETGLLRDGPSVVCSRKLVARYQCAVRSPGAETFLATFSDALHQPLMRAPSAH